MPPRITRPIGAQNAALLCGFLAQAVALAGTGAAIGLVAAAALSAALRSQLFGVSPLDPLTYVAVAGALLLTATLASYLPARRAAAVEPMEVLRAD